MRVASSAGRALLAARALIGCAVLLGLLAMHGLPVAGGSGCHGGPVMIVSSGSPVTVGGPSSPDPGLSARAGGMAAQAAAGVSMAGPAEGGGWGASCVSTPPRTPAALSGPLLVAVGVLLLAVLLPLVMTRAGVRRRRGWVRRGPPPAGIVLLTRVCVSRT